jgi:SAM-dependent methyltransferase
MTDHTRQEVRAFYDQIGWSQVGEGLYQNARYEDLRPVVREYIHRCHLRINRFLAEGGKYLLDAGSGPVQYPEYLTYSKTYQYRVCADISITALREARQRVGPHGLYVVADVSRLPFRDEIFDGIVTLHTIHHVPFEEQIVAYQELYRTLRPGQSAAVVNGWQTPVLMQKLAWLISLQGFVYKWIERFNRIILRRKIEPSTAPTVQAVGTVPTGTYTVHWEPTSLKAEFARLGIAAEIRSWRSLSVRFTRAVMHAWLGGRLWLRLVFWLEDRFPTYFGENGQYPLIVIRKPGSGG